MRCTACSAMAGRERLHAEDRQQDRSRRSASASPSQRGPAGVAAARLRRTTVARRLAKCVSLPVQVDRAGWHQRPACAALRRAPRTARRSRGTSTAASSGRRHEPARHARSPWREPMVWLVAALPLASVIAAFGLLIVDRRSSGSNDLVVDPVQRTAQVQVADLGPDARAQQLALSARCCACARDRVEVLPVTGDFDREHGAVAAAGHPGRAALDRRLALRALARRLARRSARCDGRPRLDRAAAARPKRAGAMRRSQLADRPARRRAVRALTARGAAPWLPSPCTTSTRRYRRAPRHVAAAAFHCGEPLPPAPRVLQIDGSNAAFCCDGLRRRRRSGSATPHLDDYYRLRSDAAPVGSSRGRHAISRALGPRRRARRTRARRSPAAAKSALLTDGMRCAACAWLIDRALRARAGRARGRRQCGHRTHPRGVGSAAHARCRPCWRGWRRWAIGRTWPPAQARRTARRAERRRWLLRVGVAGLGAMQAMMFAEALYLDTAQQMPLPTRDFFRWITFLVVDAGGVLRRAGRSWQARGANCASAGWAWTRWSPPRRCWPRSPAWSRPCAAARMSGTTPR